MQATMFDQNQHSPYVDPEVQPDERTYGMFIHLVGLLSVLDVSGLLIGIAQFVMWQIKKGDSSFIDDHGREAVNFQISLFIWVLAIAIGSVVFIAVTFGLGALIAVPVAVVLGIMLVLARLVGAVLGAMAANNGRLYRYPMCIRVLHPAETVREHAAG